MASIQINLVSEAGTTELVFLRRSHHTRLSAGPLSTDRTHNAYGDEHMMHSDRNISLPEDSPRSEK